MEQSQEGIDWHAKGEDVPGWYLAVVALGALGLGTTMLWLLLEGIG